jgi:hypothetical protein
MELREGPSDALLDEIVTSGYIARQTLRIPSKVRQQGFDSLVQGGLRGSALLTGYGAVIGDRCYLRLSARHFFIASHWAEFLSPRVPSGRDVSLSDGREIVHLDGDDPE